MIKYVALLRGIAPTNPNMRQAKLCGVIESLGFSNVHAVIGSGNVVFETDNTDIEKMEEMMEAAWPKQLGFASTTVIRSHQQLKDLADCDPFKSIPKDPNNYLVVSFFKYKAKLKIGRLPYQPMGKYYKIIELSDNGMCTVVDLSQTRTPDFMPWIDKLLNKNVTTRTWATVHRILKKME